MRQKFFKDIPTKLKLCLVTNRKDRSHEWLANTVRRAAIGGVTMVQLREKDSISDHDFINLSKLLLRTLESFRVPLIINDRVDICHIVGAHGVHLGQNDMHPDEARKILGKPAIIGLSLECPKHLDQANMLDSIDYVAASHIFESKTKPTQTDPEFAKLWGVDGIKKLHGLSRHPIISIGGINLNNVGQIIRAGSTGIAVVSSILEAECPTTASKSFLSEINNNSKRQFSYAR
jgi:thiamine-phosphate pyrophosphorylase